MSMLLRWRTRDSGRLARLAALGLRTAGSRVVLRGGEIEVIVEPGGSADDRLELLEATPDAVEPAATADAPRPPARLLAVGWGTVDLDRAAADSGLGATELPPDRLLGARAARLGDGPIVLLEPDTEGRTAAALARHGEGPIALYVADDGGLWSQVSAPRAPDGPFGPCRLLGVAPMWGPFLIAVALPPDPSDTIAG